MKTFNLDNPIENQEVICCVMGQVLTQLQAIQLRNFLTDIIIEKGNIFYESNRNAL